MTLCRPSPVSGRADKTSAGGTGPGDPFERLPDELVFRPIRSRNLFEETVERLREAIRLGVVPTGERFPTEREIVERLGVSRVTVRSALLALSESGLVEIRRGRSGGAYVVERDGKRQRRSASRLAKDLGPELADALDFRRAIEPEIAELAAERHTPDALKAAQELVDAVDTVPRTTRALRAVDSRFHLALADMTSSPSLVAASTDLQLRLSELLAAIPVLEESIRHSRKQHQSILNAIEAGDRDAARAAMLEHISATAALLRALI
jgi:DNA-binding FadR family transcriptional regulator